MLRFLEPIGRLGHHLYTDNLYTSPRLFFELRVCGFEARGTLRLNRRGVPAEAKTSLQKGKRRAIASRILWNYHHENAKKVEDLGKTLLKFIYTCHNYNNSIAMKLLKHNHSTCLINLCTKL